MPDLTKANAARLAKALDRLYRYGDEGVMTLGEYLRRHTFVLKKQYVTVTTYKYMAHGTWGENRQPDKVVSKSEYCLWTDSSGIAVPKIVWDTFDLTVSTHSEAVTKRQNWWGWD